MTVIINDNAATTVAILEVSNYDDKFQATANLAPDEAWRWHAMDPDMGEVCALVALDAYEYEVRPLYHPMDAMEGRPVPVVPEGSGAVEDLHRRYEERAADAAAEG